MSRSVPEWRGETDQTPIPPRVKLRIFQRHDGTCPACGRKLRPGHFEFDHIVSLINGGKNAEHNLQPLCDEPCHGGKTRSDVAEKALVYRKSIKHLGIKRRKGRPMAGSRASGLKKKMDGTVVRR